MGILSVKLTFLFLLTHLYPVNLRILSITTYFWLSEESRLVLLKRVLYCVRKLEINMQKWNSVSIYAFAQL